MHYDKLEVGRNECYATDAEVVGVFLQRCSAIERAREKIEELLPRFEYFAEDENEDDELDFSWDGTRPDDVGRTIEDRVYVSRHAIEDPSPTKKRARTATDAGDMTFEAAEPFLAAMKQGELVAAIGRAWDQSPALRSELDIVTAVVWSRAPNQSLMLAHNWEEDPPPRYGDRGTVYQLGGCPRK